MANWSKACEHKPPEAVVMCECDRSMTAGASFLAQSSKRRFESCIEHVESVRQHSAECRGFSPGSPVSSHREKLDRVGLG